MPADRFFTPANLQSGGSLRIEGSEHHHLLHVMRLGKGDPIEIVNGKGILATGTIHEVNKKSALVEIDSILSRDEPVPKICLAVPFMRVSKLEWIVEKGTELGVHSFFFYPAQYSEKDDFSPRQLERLYLLTIAALKQSGRLYLPSIELLADMSHLFVKDALFLFGDIHSTTSIATLNLQTSTIIFISGPERGFSETEVSLLETRAQGVRLSAHILRAETAPIAAVSILGALL